ncbi:MAG: hypothetical protein FWE57_11575 [Chitinispirillia bacterium]|nr:hypothetical protein [Chitinispirillia bacterium]
MKTLYRFVLVSFLIVVVLLLDYCTAGTPTLLPEEQDEVEFYTLMGFEQSEYDW